MIPLESIPADVVCFPIKFLAEEIWLGILSVYDASYHQIFLKIASHSTREERNCNQMCNPLPFLGEKR
jgi:hypothetical protein